MILCHCHVYRSLSIIYMWIYVFHEPSCRCRFYIYTMHPLVETPINVNTCRPSFILEISSQVRLHIQTENIPIELKLIKFHQSARFAWHKLRDHKLIAIDKIAFSSFFSWKANVRNKSIFFYEKVAKSKTKFKYTIIIIFLKLQEEYANGVLSCAH